MLQCNNKTYNSDDLDDVSIIFLFFIMWKYFPNKKWQFSFPKSFNIWSHVDNRKLILPLLKIPHGNSYFHSLCPWSTNTAVVFLRFWSKFIGGGKIWKGAEVKKHRKKKYHESLEYFQGPKWLLLCHSNINKLSHNHWLSVAALHTKIFLKFREIQTEFFIHYKKGDEQVTNMGWEEIMSCNSEWSLGLPLPEGCSRGHIPASCCWWGEAGGRGALGSILEWYWNLSETWHSFWLASGKVGLPWL